MTRYINILLFGIISIGLPAQEIQLSLKVGYNLSKVRMVKQAQTFTTEPLDFAFHLGFSLNIPISPILNFQPEMLYSLQGGIDTMENQKWQKGFLNIPLLLQFQPIKYLSIELGPQLGFVFGPIYHSVESFFSFEGDLLFADVGLGIGSSVSISKNTALSFRYTIGFSKVERFQQIENYPLKIQNRVLQFSIIQHLGKFEKRSTIMAE
ncbi:porin family protein [Aegicerativicinus sediminis]